ncbi:MAG: multicopper oxidase family protein [Gaiellaceae bacterium]
MRRAAVTGVVGAVVLAAVTLVGWIGWLWYDSRLPDTYSVMDHGGLDYGGGRVPSSGHHAGGPGISVTDLRGPQAESPDATFTLTAQTATMRLASGRTVDALTFGGRSPGPELRVRQGDLVQVTLVNEDVVQGVTIHWHGVDVPNAEDGVAGVTQDAVLPGERYVYRFRAEQVGTFWYHSHQVSSEEVRRGLFGAFVIEPAEPRHEELDLALAVHTYEGVPTLNANDGVAERDAAPGTRVRLRLINSDNVPHGMALAGTRFRVIALDGTDLNEPSPMEDALLEVAGGGRADIAFTVPERPVRLSLVDTDVALAFNADGRASPLAERPDAEFDPATYGLPAATPFNTSSRFDRSFELSIGRWPGFLDGRPGLQWTINGGIFPHVPTFVVEEGDLVHVTITNDTNAVHPMHLHGHHVLVLSRDGRPVSGSPWWADTLNVEGGERYEVAFRANNPGIWMDHCHNLRHAADGLTMHVFYAGVTTPFTIGGAPSNEPE